MGKAPKHNIYLNDHLDQELENVIERKNKKVKSCDLTEKNSGRPIDDTVIDFFRISCGQLTTLQFFDVKGGFQLLNLIIRELKSHMTY